MDEKRQQEYLELIKKLLSCSTDEEINQILLENKNLLDVGFSQTVETEVEKALNKGDERTAGRLRTLANARDKALDLPSSVPKPSPIVNVEHNLEFLNKAEFQPYGQFLVKVLQVIDESEGDTQVVYPLLEANLDKLDANLAEILRRWATSIFDKAEEAESIGFAIGNFSNLIQQFPLGNKANNMEIVITGYEIMLTTLTQEASPEIWVSIQNNLGIAYSERIKGDKADNIELAINSYKNALIVYTRNDFPYEWAMTQNNLGDAYCDRIKGNKADNIELAINSYQELLSVYTRNDFPYEWAMTQNNLGAAYKERIKGDKTDNIELAINSCQEALSVYTRNDFPYEWARTQYNLGIAYEERIKGNKADNIELAINSYQEALTVRNRNDFPYEWAKTQNNLGDAYCDRIKGNKADNIELAINSCQKALSVYTRNDFPYEWAMTQNNLGNAHCKRIKGDKADNIELAINSYQEALTVRNRNDFPQDWAGTLSNLGIACYQRIKGIKADNIELAINNYQEALTVRNRNDFPQDWAGTLSNLGNAHCKRIKGNKADNIELAINNYQEALIVYTRNDFPQDWARTLSNLGAAYYQRIKGNKTDNIELAINNYQEALIVRTCNDFPQDWATTQNNLGTAYRERIKGNKADNIELAINSCQEALTVRTRNDFPYEWAETLYNLGNAYRERIKGNKADNIELTINSFQELLIVYTRNDFPYEWAMTQNSLGLAYWERIKGDKADNIELAISIYEEALIVYTRNDFPYEWAKTQNNLGIAYSDRIKGNKADNIELAINSYQNALTVYTPTVLPIDCLKTARILGKLLFELKRWQEAISAYDKAIQAVELSRSWATDNTRRQEILENAINVYKNIVQACINNEQPEKAIEYAERSKARNLVELLATRDLYPKGDIPETIISELDHLRKRIREEQIYLSRQAKSQIQDTNKDENQIKVENQKWEASRQHLEQLQQQIDELIKNQIQPIDPSFSLTQKVKSIKFKEIQSLLDARTAIIEWYITEDKIIAFLITSKPLVLFFNKRGANANVWQSHPEDRNALFKWTNEYLENYYNKDKKSQWQEKLDERLKKLAEILHIDELITQIPKECDRLILIPHNFLHIFPLHALEVKNLETSINQCLLELFPGGVSYAPSCQLLQLAQNQKRPDFKSFFGIQNPTQDLTFAELEVNSISYGFQQHQVLSEQQATKDNLSQKNLQLEQIHCLHFSCHGSFQINFPLNSYFQLAAALIPKIPTDADNQDYIQLDKDKILDLNKCLTLSNLFERKIDLKKCRLVVLSACETGLIDFSNSSDEYIGLPSGFLYAGSPSVISSLWNVNDISTALLMIEFYENLQNIDIPIALKEAQNWLRNVTKKELKKWAKKKLYSADYRMQLQSSLFKHLDSDKPFKSPYYWAAFCAIGR
jgi:CHAT domain-containing protein